MLIRETQVDTFRGNARSQFEMEMLVYMKGYAPELCQIRGDELIMNVIRSGIERAEAAGFKLRGSVRLFLELLFSLGTGFDDDPQLAWAGQVIRDRSLDEQSRATRLYIRARNFLDDVAGPDNIYASEALSRRDAMQSFVATRGGLPLDRRILDLMNFMHPQKFRAAGEPALRAIIAKAAQEAVASGLPAERGTILLAGLMYGLGHAIAMDPLYPWVGGTLRNPAVTDGETRATRLYEKTKTYIAALERRKAQKNVQELR